MCRVWLADKDFGGFVALTTDVQSGGEVVAVDAYALDCVVFDVAVGVVGHDVFDAGLVAIVLIAGKSLGEYVEPYREFGSFDASEDA